MRKKFFSPLLIVASLMAAPFSFADNHANHEQPTTSADISKDAKALMHSLKEYSIDQRDKAVNKAEQVLANIDTRIDTLETRIDNQWDSMSKDARDNTKATLKTLRQQRNKLSEQYGRIQNSSASAWNDMKEGFANAYHALSRSWQEAEQNFASSNNNESKSP